MPMTAPRVARGSADTAVFKRDRHRNGRHKGSFESCSRLHIFALAATTFLPNALATTFGANGAQRVAND